MYDDDCETMRDQMRELSAGEIHDVAGGNISEIVLGALAHMECYKFSDGTVACVFY
jgi:methylmalonyl-CoA mutase cobalamin-binding subunit